MVGKGCVLTSSSRDDGPQVPRLAAPVWLISEMKSWSGPPRSVPPPWRSSSLPTLLHSGTELCGTHGDTASSLGCLDRQEECRALWGLLVGTLTPKGKVLGLYFRSLDWNPSSALLCGNETAAKLSSHSVPVSPSVKWGNSATSRGGRIE